jgi:type VI secretion system secreted protein VgrG
MGTSTPIEQEQEIWIDEPTNDLLLARIEGEESISVPFVYHLTLFSEKKSIPAASLLRKPVTIWLEQPTTHKRRPIHGIVSRFSQGSRDGAFTEYEMEVVPSLWLLSLSSDCRFFQDKSVMEITKAVLQEHRLDVRYACTGSYPAREYCVQYNETHLDFLSRLWEEEGIFYFFEHAGTKHTLVLADDPVAIKPSEFTKRVQNAAQDAAFQEAEFVEELRVEHAVHTGGVTIADWDFEKTSGPLSFSATSNGVGKLFEYPGPHVKPNFSDRVVRARVEHAEAMRTVVTATSTTARGLCAGYRLDVADAPAGAEALQLLRVSFSIQHAGYSTGGDAEAGYRCDFTAIPMSVPYRPPARTPKPRVHGTQTALVASTGDEISVDEYGRVKVLFHWDRKRENSCWVRVATPWAGPGMGMVHLPRVNDEVIVGFLEGDPDRPIIVGSVPNAMAMPQYTLPDNKTQSGVKTRSSPDGGSDEFNELRFEDKKGAEEVFLQAQRDFNEIVKLHHTRVVKDGNETITLEKGNQEITIEQGNQTIIVRQGDQKYEVGNGSQSTKIFKHRAVTIDTGNDELKIQQGDLTVAVQVGNVAISAPTGKITLEALQSIELKVGASVIKLDQTGIKIDGTMIKAAGTAMAELASPMTTVKGDGMLTVKGGLTMIN